MALGRGFLAALCLALVALVAFVAVSNGGRQLNQQASERQMAAMQSAAMKRLDFPGDFVRIDRGCSVSDCYLVASPASRVAAIVPRLLRAAGVQPPGRLLAAEPVSMLRLDHWSTTSSDPLVIGCKTTYTSADRPVSKCQDAGRVGQTLINVLIAPDQPCHDNTCSNPAKTEVFAWAVAFPNKP